MTMEQEEAVTSRASSHGGKGTTSSSAFSPTSVPDARAEEATKRPETPVNTRSTFSSADKTPPAYVPNIPHDPTILQQTSASVPPPTLEQLNQDMGNFPLIASGTPPPSQQSRYHETASNARNDYVAQQPSGKINGAFTAFESVPASASALPSRDAEKPSEQKSPAKPSPLPFAELHASNRSRLTMYPPNHLAHSLFLDTRKRVQASLTKRQRAQKVCWISISGILGGFGLIVCIAVIASGNGAVAPFVFMLLVLMPALLGFMWLYEKWQHLAPDKVLEVLGDILDSRARETLLDRGGLLAGFEPNVGDERGQLVVELFPGGLAPFRALQRGGYASIPSWATYHAAWKGFLSRIAFEDDQQVLDEIHAKWLELLSKIAIVSDEFCAGIDRQRVKAYKRLARQGVDFAGDTLSDLADIGDMFGDLSDMKESLEKIREAVRDSKEYKAYGIEGDWESDQPEERGLHPIQQRRLLFMIPFVSLCFFLPALSFGLLGVPAGAWAMAGIGLFMIVLIPFFATRINGSMQVLECIVDLEDKQRAVLVSLIQSRQRDTGCDKQAEGCASGELLRCTCNSHAVGSTDFPSVSVSRKPFHACASTTV